MVWACAIHVSLKRVWQKNAEKKAAKNISLRQALRTKNKNYAILATIKSRSFKSEKYLKLNLEINTKNAAAEGKEE